MTMDGRLKATLDGEYSYSGWERLRVRKESRLHIDPVHKWPNARRNRPPPRAVTPEADHKPGVSSFS